MLKHTLVLCTIVASVVSYLTPTQVHSQDEATPTIEEIIKQGDEITKERLAGYKDFDCGQIKAELAYVAGRYEYGATPRMIGGTIFIGGDLRYLIAIKDLMKVANEKACEVRSIECSDYPRTCKGLSSFRGNSPR